MGALHSQGFFVLRCAGLALDRHDVLEFSAAEDGLEIAVTGEGAHTLPADESHLVVRAFRAACAELGWNPPGLSVVAENAIPQGRGMGSSAAAVVAGTRTPTAERLLGRAGRRPPRRRPGWSAGRAHRRSPTPGP